MQIFTKCPHRYLIQVRHLKQNPTEFGQCYWKNQGEAQNFLMLIQQMWTQSLTCDILYLNLEKCAQTRKVLFENKAMLHTFTQNKWPLTHIIQNPLVYFRNLGLILFDAMI